METHILVVIYQGEVKSVKPFEDQAEAEEEFQRKTGCNYYDFQAKLQEKKVDYTPEMILGDYAGSYIFTENIRSKGSIKYVCPDCKGEFETASYRIRCKFCQSLNLERELPDGRLLKADAADCPANALMIHAP